jgi:hypothetical protein
VSVLVVEDGVGDPAKDFRYGQSADRVLFGDCDEAVEPEPAAVRARRLGDAVGLEQQAIAGLKLVFRGDGPCVNEPERHSALLNEVDRLMPVVLHRLAVVAQHSRRTQPDPGRHQTRPGQCPPTTDAGVNSASAAYQPGSS